MHAAIVLEGLTRAGLDNYTRQARADRRASMYRQSSGEAQRPCSVIASSRWRAQATLRRACLLVPCSAGEPAPLVVAFHDQQWIKREHASCRACRTRTAWSTVRRRREPLGPSISRAGTW